MKSPGLCQGGTHEMFNSGVQAKSLLTKEAGIAKKIRKEQLHTPEQFEVGSFPNLGWVQAKSF
jgi:hypothetical protein